MLVFFRNRFFFPVLLCILSGIVYIRTIAPTFTWGDSPEFSAVSFLPGIAHPTGYPLYTIIGKLFCFLPVGTIAFRTNLMTACFSIVSLLFLYLIVFEITKNRFCGFIPALLFGVSRTLWNQSITSEVYSLHILLVSMIIFLLIKRKTFLLALSSGLALTNHMLTLFVSIPVLYYAIAERKENNILKPANLIKCILIFAIGLSVYVYLPARARQNPELNWGNPASVKNFVWVVTAREFKGKMFSGAGGDLANNFTRFVKLLIEQANIIVILISIAGFLSCFKEFRKHVIMLLLIIILNLAYALNYDIPDIDAYYLQTYFVVFVGVGLFLFRLTNKFKKSAVFISIAFLIFPILSYVENVKFNDFSNYYYAHDYGKNMFKSVKENSVMLIESNHPAFTLWYLQKVENHRRDVSILFRPLLGYDWYSNQIKREKPQVRLLLPEQADLGAIANKFKTRSEISSFLAVKENIDRLNVYAVEDNIPLLSNYYFIENTGFIYRINKQNAIDENLELFLTIRTQDNKRVLDLEALSGLTNLSSAERNAGNNFFNKKDFHKALFHYGNALMIDPEDYEAMNNIGTVYLEQKDYSRAEQCYKNAIQTNPDFSLARKNLGALYHLTGRKQSALLEWQKAYGLNPEDAELRQLLSR